MAEITAALVKELRERTGEGMMDCKKALTKAGGDIEKAIDDMRASGAIKAAKKAGNIAAEGAIGIKDDGKAAVIIEVNSQTDFLALQDDFKAFVAASVEKAFADKLTDAAPLIAAQESAREALVAKVAKTSTSVVWFVSKAMLSVLTCTATRSVLLWPSKAATSSWPRTSQCTSLPATLSSCCRRKFPLMPSSAKKPCSCSSTKTRSKASLPKSLKNGCRSYHQVPG